MFDRTADRTGGSVELGSEPVVWWNMVRTASSKADFHECFKFGPRGLMWVVFVVDLHGFDLSNISGSSNPSFEGFFKVNSLIPEILDSRASSDILFANFLIKCNVLK